MVPAVWLLMCVILSASARPGYKKPLRDGHVPFDDSLDDGWNSLGVDDVASWFGQVQNKVHLDDIEPVEEEQTTPKKTTTESTAGRKDEPRTTLQPSAVGSRQQVAAKHQNAGKSRQPIAATPNSHVVVPQTPAVPAATTVPASVTELLGGIVDYPKRTISDDDSADDDSSDEATPINDPCLGVYCRAGRVCRPPAVSHHSVSGRSARGRCVCGDADHCSSAAAAAGAGSGHRSHHQQQHHEVCGTDGKWYPSHCELHRIACVTEKHIGVDRLGTSCEGSATPQEKPNTDSMTDTPSGSYKVEAVTVAPPTHPVNVNVSEVFSVDTPPRLDCTRSRFDRMKASLLSYHCARDTSYDCGEDEHKKKNVVDDMFDYYDWSGDDHLEIAELNDVEQRDHLDRLSQHCHLSDLLVYADQNNDGFITLNEFYALFDQLTPALDNLTVLYYYNADQSGIKDSESTSTGSQSQPIPVYRTTVTFGNSVELKCDSNSESVNVIWKRNGNQLHDLEDHRIKVFSDGSLYIGELSLHHIGNYTCQAVDTSGVIQTHVLLVQMQPKVKVAPSVQFHLAGSSATLRCRANGLPDPELYWLKDNTSLTTMSANKQEEHTVQMHSGATLEIRSSSADDGHEDSGTYSCVAKNTAGLSQESGSVTFQRDDVSGYLASDVKQTELAAVFHQNGYTVYELTRCHVDHLVSGDFVPTLRWPLQRSTPRSMCASTTDGSNVTQCSWTTAVLVRGRFIYAAQPELNRIVVIETYERLNPVEFILTDAKPVSLRYVEHLDQVWVTCKSTSETDGDVILPMVVRDASSSNMAHRAVHVQPVDEDTVFDMVNGVFLPPANDLDYAANIGYVARAGEKSLRKLDLAAMKYSGDIDLSSYQCYPVDVSYLPIGGRIVIGCAESDDVSTGATHQLVLDYVTDRVIDQLNVGGRLFTSPDLRTLVVVNQGGNTITVFNVATDGTLTRTFDEHTQQLSVKNVAFFPTRASHGYSIYASTSSDDTVLHLDLGTGKVDHIKGSGTAVTGIKGVTGSEHSVIVPAAGQFAGHVITLKENAVVVIDGGRHHIDCEWQEIVKPTVAVALVG